MSIKRRRNSSGNRLSGISSLPVMDNYDPCYCLCCHSIVEGEKRGLTKVWMCAFEPNLNKQGESGTILATCGGNTVCFIDVMTGLVMKRFKDTDRAESFYSLAWTTLEGDGKKLNVLAVAGEGSSIKLIYPDQLVCYSTIKGGSKDGFIMLWNIGAPGAEGSVNHSPLLKLKTSAVIGDALSMVFNVKTGVLIAVTEKGCVGWSLGHVSSLSSSQKTRVLEKHNFSFMHPKSGSSRETVDSLVALDNDLVATKCVGSGEILVWSLEDHVRSGGSASKQIQVEPLLHLEFPETSVEYLNMGYSRGVVGVGDDKGNIHLYDVREAIRSKSAASATLLPPSRVIEWPEIDGLTEQESKAEVVMNTVALTSDHTVVAGGTDNNLVCIWRQAPS